MSYKDAIAHDARLIILRETAKQTDGQLNEVSLRRALDVYGITRSRDWIATQLNRLEELEAVTITHTGEIMVAAITRAGRDHLESRSIIVGITRPSELG